MSNEMIVYEYKTDTNTFRKEVDKAKKSQEEMTKSSDELEKKTSKLGNTFTLVAGATGVALGVLSAAVFNTGLEFNAMQESTHKALTILLESEEAASSLEKEMKKLADSSQFDLSAVNQLGVSLINAGVAAEDVPGKMNDIMDSVGALGGSTAELESVTRAIGQMYSKGKISAEEMNQLAEVGIPAWQLLAEAMGLSVAEVMKLGSEGKLTTKEIDLLVETMGKKYEGGAAIDTFPEKLANMKSQFAEMSGVIMQIFTPALTSAVDSLTVFFDAFDQGIPPEFMEMLKNVSLGIGLITLAIGSWAAAQLILTGTISLTGAALMSITWPIALIAIGIFILAAAFIRAYKQSEVLRMVVNETFVLIGQTFILLMKVLVTGWGLMTKALSKFWAIFGNEITFIFVMAFLIVASTLKFFILLFNLTVKVCQLFWQTFGETIKEIFQTAMVGIGGALKIFKGIFQVFTGLLTGDWSLMAEGFKKIWDGLCDYLIYIFNGLFILPLKLFLDLIGVDWETFVSFMKQAWELGTIAFKLAFEVFANFFNFTISAIQLWWQTTCNFMQNIWGLFTGAITGLFTGFKNIFDSIVGGIKNGWQNMCDFMTMLWDNSIGKMIDGIQNLANFAGDALSKIPFVGGMFGGKSSLSVKGDFPGNSNISQGNSNVVNNYNFQVKSENSQSMRQAYRSGRAMVLSRGGTL